MSSVDLQLLYVAVTSVSLINLFLLYYIFKKCIGLVKVGNFRPLKLLVLSSVLLFIGFIFEQYFNFTLGYKLFELFGSFIFVWVALAIYSSREAR